MPDATPLDTLRFDRTVVAVARTIQSTTRTLDALNLLRDDPRINIVAAYDGDSEFRDGVQELLKELRLQVLSWKEAKKCRADLVVSATSHSPVHQLKAPAFLIPHGAGHHKRRGSKVVELPHERLMRHPRSRIMLPGEESHQLLEQHSSETAKRSIVAGDLTLQALRRGQSRRAAYRNALGLRPGQRLVTIASTWGMQSLVGRWKFEFAHRVASELPVDEWRVAVITHPNITARHGDYNVDKQIRVPDTGLLRINSQQGWEATLAASDCVISDHGSLGFYAADICPVLLAIDHADEYSPTGPVAAMFAQLPHVDHALPLAPQLEAAIAGYSQDDARGIIARSIATKDTARIYRSTMYELLELEDPAPFATPRITPDDPVATGPRAAATLVRSRITDSQPPAIHVTRVPSTSRETSQEHNAHQAVNWHGARGRMQELATVLVSENSQPTPDELLRDTAVCQLAAQRTGPGHCHIVTRSGLRLELRWPGSDEIVELVASACYELIVRQGRPATDFRLNWGQAQSAVVECQEL